jgi:nicotinamide-nucleotide amidase
MESGLDQQLYDLAAAIGRSLKTRGWLLASAESCTGGWIGQCVTMVPGSSAWFDRGFITYTNDSKVEMLGVRNETLQSHGAVSEQTVREMVQGTLARSHAHIAAAVSGVAGPSGGTAEKPVGMVCLGWGVRDGVVHTITLQLSGDRNSVRRQSVIAALEGVKRLADAGIRPTA